MAFMKKKSKMAEMVRRSYGAKYHRYNLRPEEIAVPMGPQLGGWPAISSFAWGNPWHRLNKKQKSLFWTALLAAALLLKSAAAVYYYNLLIDTEQNMMAAYANVQALVQRKNDIAINLSKAVRDYSDHERQVLTSIVKLRALIGAENPQSGAGVRQLRQAMADAGAGDSLPQGEHADVDQLMSSLTKLMAVAEQYPDLKLSSNFEALMAALVQVESDLATERIKYNEQANIYTTNLAKFPGNIFAWIFDFETQPYFDADQAAKSFKIIGY